MRTQLDKTGQVSDTYCLFQQIKLHLIIIQKKQELYVKTNYSYCTIMFTLTKDHYSFKNGINCMT